MRLTLQKYDLLVKYTPCKELYIADTLSRNPSKEEESEVFEVNVLECLPLRDETLEECRQAISRDKDLSTMLQYAKSQWPSNKEDIPEEMKSASLARLHKAHSGVEKTLHRAKEALYWPAMQNDIKQVVENCSVCKEHKPRQ
ncbi:uncharacterized protein LOC121834105 [Ixodes scapularis]|uniref:uncharacterized protein LOC121834105 n=1 Tax=Ixodes scapularis TaxID=6945 RepID=UPI001C381B68|nr:uncharacterized protein LOC121834105 [Ixodes scapularis]